MAEQLSYSLVFLDVLPWHTNMMAGKGINFSDEYGLTDVCTVENKTTESNSVFVIFSFFLIYET